MFRMRTLMKLFVICSFIVSENTEGDGAAKPLIKSEELSVKNEVWRMRFGFGLRFVEGW